MYGSAALLSSFSSSSIRVGVTTDAEDSGSVAAAGSDAVDVVDSLAAEELLVAAEELLVIDEGLLAVAGELSVAVGELFVIDEELPVVAELFIAAGAVGSVEDAADDSVVVALSGVWILLCCEPVPVIMPLIAITLDSFLTAQLPHFGVRIISVPIAAFMVKLYSGLSFTNICSV